MALSYHQGNEVERDYQEAEKYYKEALTYGEHPKSLVGLGRIYLKGNGVAPDFALASELFHRAVAEDPENADANFHLGDLYLRGLSVPRRI